MSFRPFDASEEQGCSFADSDYLIAFSLSYCSWEYSPSFSKDSIPVVLQISCMSLLIFAFAVSSGICQQIIKLRPNLSMISAVSLSFHKFVRSKCPDGKSSFSMLYSLLSAHGRFLPAISPSWWVLELSLHEPDSRGCSIHKFITPRYIYTLW